MLRPKRQNSSSEGREEIDPLIHSFFAGGREIRDDRRDIGNGGGRVIAGVLSDLIGRRATLCLCLILQAGLMLLLAQAKAGTPLASIGIMAVISALIGAFYGANLALFPAITKDYYGLKNFGMNYGLVFTAWGIGGFVMAMIAGRLHDAYHVYTYSFYIAAVLLAVAASGTVLLCPPQKLQSA